MASYLVVSVPPPVYVSDPQAKTIAQSTPGCMISNVSSERSRISFQSYAAYFAYQTASLESKNVFHENV